MEGVSNVFVVRNKILVREVEIKRELFFLFNKKV